MALHGMTVRLLQQTWQCFQLWILSHSFMALMDGEKVNFSQVQMHGKYIGLIYGWIKRNVEALFGLL